MSAVYDDVKADLHAASQALSGTAPVWPQPTEIKVQLPAAPAFDAHVLLPRVLADFVLDEADRMPCAPDYIGAALIVALGSVIGARCAIKPKRRDDWIVTPNLFGGVVGDPSAKKTPAVSTAMRFLDRLEAKEADALVDKRKVFEAETAAFEARQSAIQSLHEEGRIEQGRRLEDGGGSRRPARPGRARGAARTALQEQRRHGRKTG